MTMYPFLSAVAFCIVGLWLADTAHAAPDEEPGAPDSALDFTVDRIDGGAVKLSDAYAGKVVLIVNTASKCGHTKQYAGLEALYQEHRDAGLVVLGFPCNQFKNQEPGSDADIAAFCEQKYGVTFPMFSKLDVNGDDAAPLYKYLTGPALPEAKRGPVKWNFEKFLVGRDGKVVGRYASKVTPESDELRGDVEKALAAPAGSQAAAE